MTAEGVSFRIWAPDREQASIVLENGLDLPLASEPGGYFGGTFPLDPATRYRIRLDDDATLYPDPASRYQPQGPHGPSSIVDPGAFAWTDRDWPGSVLRGQVVYEMHVGTFTPEGTWRSAAEKLPLLKDVGVTLIEMMPVNDFPGRFGWGYDGVNLFAPARIYGEPDDLRFFIDTAHALGIGVILDVVYNHLGPDGNYLTCFTKDYFTDRYENEWGEAINFDGPNAAGVREFFIANARYWIEEFHFDGLRLDATQTIHDASPNNIIAEIAAAARQAANPRSIVLIAENEPQHTSLARALDQGGYGLDALWNDDFHHSVMVALTGRSEAYYEDHDGSPQEFISAAKYGCLFQGQLYAHQQKRRGTPGLDLAPAAFVTFAQNHDQIANSGRGLRLHLLTTQGRARAITALLLLLPGTPMLFQGQEFWASQPFLYFADHASELARLVSKGRAEFLSQFSSLTDPAALRKLRDPGSEQTFRSCRLDWREFDRNAEIVALHRDLLRLRRDDPVFAAQEKGRLDGAVLADEAFVLRFFGLEGDDRLLFVNLGRDLKKRSLAEPLVAPPEGREWQLAWSSENPAYGGCGTPPVETENGWYLPSHAAIVLAARPLRPETS